MKNIGNYVFKSFKSVGQSRNRNGYQWVGSALAG